MLTTRVTKIWTFDAAHRIPNHGGKCKNLHGHTYKLEVTVEGAVVNDVDAPDDGMVLDFDVLSAIWKAHLEPQLDHRYLNESLPHVDPPTAERLASWAAYEFTGHLPNHRVRLVSLRLWETPTAYAEVSRP